MTNIVMIVQNEDGETCFCEEYLLLKPEHFSLLSLCSRGDTTKDRRCTTDSTKIMGTPDEFENTTSLASKRDAIYFHPKRCIGSTSLVNIKDATKRVFEGGFSCHDHKETEDGQEIPKRSSTGESLTGRTANRTVLRKRTISICQPSADVLAQQGCQRTDMGASSEPKPHVSARAKSNVQDDRSMASLTIDLYPRKLESQSSGDNGDFVPVSLGMLAPMRSLRSLKLTGMTRSYQRQIWRAVWLNPELEYLELEMAESPICRTRRPTRFRRTNVCNKSLRWPHKPIRGDWSLPFADEASGIYQ